MTGIVERAFAAFEPLQPRQRLGNAERLGHSEPFIDMLRQHADRARAMDRAFDRLRCAGDQAQQRGLAAAIASDKAGALAPQRKRQAIEERASVRRGKGNRVQDNRWHGELPEWIGIAAR